MTAANTFARAVIAAAGAYGDDPLAAFRVRRGPGRRYLTPAAYGLHLATALPITIVCRSLGLHATAVSDAKRKAGDAWWRAAQAAERAARFCAWRPEAVESVQSAPVAPPTPPPTPKPDHLSAIRAALAKPPAAPNNRRAQEKVFGVTGRVPAKAADWLTSDSRALSDRILRQLSIRPASAMSLATLLDAKEAVVGQALSILEHQGAVRAGDVPEAGARHRLWSPAEAA